MRDKNYSFQDSSEILDNLHPENELESMRLPLNKFIRHKISFEEMKNNLVEFKRRLVSDKFDKSDNALIALRQEISDLNQELIYLY